MSLKSLKNQTLRNKSTVNSVNLTGGASTGPVITSIIVTDSNYNNLDDTALLPAGGYAKLIGSGFASGCSAYFNGSSVTTTFVSSTEVRVVIPATTAGTYNVMLFNPSTAGAIYLNLGVSAAPTFTTSAGSLGTSYETTAVNTSIAATGDTPITYALYSGSLPSGVTLSSNGTLSGTSPVEASSTTYSFVVQATDAQLQDTTRSFSLTISTDVVTWSTPAADYAYTLTGNEAMSNVTLSAASAAGYNITYAANTLPTGVSLSGNTVYGTPTVEQTVYTALTATAATTGRSATRYVSWSIALGDTYWKYNTLLIPGASTTFVDDDSTNNFAVTLNGDTKPNSFNPYTPGYYSNYFNGSSYLNSTITSTTIGTNNFTVECWVYPTAAYGSLSRMFIFGPAGGSNYLSFFINSSAQIVYGPSGSGLITTSSTVPLNAWTHIAISRNSGTTNVYVNGVSGGSSVDGTNFPATTTFYLGQDGVGNYFTGYISNFRLVNGSAVYTSAFTPPTTPLTAITNTTLLTCQSNRFIDKSTNNFTLTMGGTLTVNSFQPFTPNTSYSTYGSGYFDGSGDYLILPDDSAFDFPGDFTVEAWVYLNSVTGAQGVYSSIDNSADSWVGVTLSFSGTSFLATSYISGNDTITHQTAVTAGQWYHIAIVRNGSSTKSYLNGVQSTTTTLGTYSLTQSGGTIGSAYPGSSPLNGYISNLRVVKGTALYTASFTPPTTPLTAISGTSLLTLQNNQSVNSQTFLDNSSNNFLVTRNGNATQGTFSPYGGNWSNYFDGSGDYLQLPAGTAIMGTSDFTIELWVYHTAGGAWAGYYYQGEGGSGGGLNFRKNNLDQLSLSHDGVVDVFTSTATIPINQWVHIACTRSSGTMRFFINGTVVGTVSYATSFTGTTGTQTIGSITSGVYYLAGYISNIRIVKGTAVYTAAFTPPTTPLIAITGTEILTCQSNRLVDNSIKNNTITKAGDVSVQRFSPFNPASVTPTSYSGYFDGTGDYISAAGTNLALSTGDFTIECWFYRMQSGRVDGIYTAGRSPSASGGFGIKVNSDNKIWWNTNTSYGGGTGVTINANQWYHIAITRQSGTLKWYINGVLDYTGTGFTQDCTNQFALFGITDDPTYTNMYISNARIVKGTALYTTSFTPSTTPLTTTSQGATASQVSLLTLQSNTLIDNSTYNYPITAYGDAKQTIQNPFGYTSALTNGYSVSTIGGSGYFDGTGDYLTLAANSSLTITAGPSFTMEAWIYPVTNTEGYPIIVSQDDGGNSNQCFQFRYLTNNNTLSFVYFTTSARSSAVGVATTNSVILNQWNHVAVCWTGTNLYLFINGIVGFSGAVSTLYGATNSPTWIGVLSSLNTTAYFKGYISDLRMIRGQALYTSNFVPPSLTPLSAIQNTVLLTNMTNAGIYDAAMMNDMETVGDAKLSTAVSKFGGSSMYFDGSGDSVDIRVNNPPLFSQKGSYTIEMWIYPTNVSTAQYFYSQVTTNFLQFAMNASGKIEIDRSGVGVVITSTNALTINTWQHLALVSDGTNLKLYVNGTQSGSTAAVGTQVDPAAGIIRIGAYHNSGGSPSLPYYGYIDDLRVTTGYARYTANFTAPTSAFQIK